MTAPVVDVPKDQEPSNPATPATPQPKDPTEGGSKGPEDERPKGAPQKAPDPGIEQQPHKAPAVPAVPDKYVLSLPDGSPADPALPERTAAIARELGLSQAHAEKTLGFVAQEVAAQVKQLVDAHAPGGEQWKATEAKWREAALADPFLGNGNPERFDANVKLAERVVAKYGDEESVQLFNEDPMASHPALLRLLVRLGKASGEKDLVLPTGDNAPGRKSDAEVFYGGNAGKTSAEVKEAAARV